MVAAFMLENCSGSTRFMLNRIITQVITLFNMFSKLDMPTLNVR